MGVSRGLWIAIALAACSGPSSSSGGSSPDGACADWAAAYCARLNSCAPSTLGGLYGTLDECAARNKPICLGALKATATGATPATVEACSRLYAADSCYDIIGGKVPDGCDTPRSLGAGKPCGDDSQCEGSGGYCKVANGQTCGTCATLGEVGAGCASDRDCAYGLVCGGTCQEPGKVGSQCDGATLVCPPSAACAGGTCAMLLGLGAPCDPQASLCDGNIGQCDGKTMVCVAYPPLAALGASCGSGTSCANSVCGAAGTCIANAADGAPCDDNKGEYCTSPAVCTNSVCVFPDASQCH